ncbi:MAG: hypothetical protein M1826_005582 [Phylliscum demangeonii]|nr:MAG: hypothetical protein M1826_005582 [Phylliscum demangeonii]
METIKSVAGAATRAIYGEDDSQKQSGQEPVSGNPSLGGTSALDAQPSVTKSLDHASPVRSAQGGVGGPTTGLQQEGYAGSNTYRGESSGVYQPVAHSTFTGNKLDPQANPQLTTAIGLEGESTAKPVAPESYQNESTGTSFSQAASGQSGFPSVLDTQTSFEPGNTVGSSAQKGSDPASAVGSSIPTIPGQSSVSTGSDAQTKSGTSNTLGSSNPTLPGQSSFSSGSDAQTISGASNTLGSSNPTLPGQSSFSSGSDAQTISSTSNAMGSSNQTNPGQSSVSTGSDAQAKSGTSNTLGSSNPTLPGQSSFSSGSDSQTISGTSNATGSSNQTIPGQSSVSTGSDAQKKSGTDSNPPGSSTVGTNSSERLVGQSDTPTGPSGGIAQGGVPQGANMPMGAAVRPEQETEKTGVTSMHRNEPHGTTEAPSSSNTSSAGLGSSQQPGGAVGTLGSAEPSVMSDPSSGQKPKQMHQGANRPTEAPSDEGAKAVRETKDAAEKAATGTTGSVAGGGGGGGGGSGRGEHKTVSMIPDDTPGEPAHGDNWHHDGPGANAGTDTDKMNESVGEGTGEKYVKTTGLLADGGDFDAALPGAGKEADRLLKEKGIQRSTPPPKGVELDDKSKTHHASSTKSAASTTEKEKESLAEKLKEKLHLGGHGHEHGHGHT